MPEQKKTNEQEILEQAILEQEKLEEKVEESADKILKMINLDDLLKDPSGYIANLAKQYYLHHKPEVMKAIEIGDKTAKKIIKEINGKKTKMDEEGNILTKQKSEDRKPPK
tara:strand:- start:808 stop:1140 length:333 start_codon:yes stop_codon:yes gene_type:complete